MGRSGHGLPKVSTGPAMPNPSTPCGWAIPENSHTAVSGVVPLGHPASACRMPSHNLWMQARISYGYPWTPSRITRARHALPLYTLQVATPETALWLFQCSPPARRPAWILHALRACPDVVQQWVTTVAQFYSIYQYGMSVLNKKYCF
jgi:hypothetical protein